MMVRTLEYDKDVHLYFVTLTLIGSESLLAMPAENYIQLAISYYYIILTPSAFALLVET